MLTPAQIRTAYLLASALGHRWTMLLTLDQALAAGSAEAIRDAARAASDEDPIVGILGPNAGPDPLVRGSTRIVHTSASRSIRYTVCGDGSISLDIRWPRYGTASYSAVRRLLHVIASEPILGHIDFSGTPGPEPEDIAMKFDDSHPYGPGVEFWADEDDERAKHLRKLNEWRAEYQRQRAG